MRKKAKFRRAMGIAINLRLPSEGQKVRHRPRILNKAGTFYTAFKKRARSHQRNILDAFAFQRHMHLNSQQRYRASHATRVMATTAASLLLLVLLVHFWPATTGHDPVHLLYRAPSREVIAMEEIQPTMQQRKPPPPPAPLPPVVMPEDRLLEDPLDLDTDFLAIEEAGLPALNTPADAAPTNALHADAGPKPIILAEPEYPRAARRRNIRAEVTLRVEIDRRGRVTSHEIVGRYLLSEEGQSRQPVEELGFGLEEAALSAAYRWMFRPARKQGEAVNSQHVLSIKFGV